MKALLTLFISAVAVVFLFRPTVKEILPAYANGSEVCILSPAVRKEKLLANYLLVGNDRYPVERRGDLCFKFSASIEQSSLEKAKVLFVREGRSLWTTVTKKK